MIPYTGRVENTHRYYEICYILLCECVVVMAIEVICKDWQNFLTQLNFMPNLSFSFKYMTALEFLKGGVIYPQSFIYCVL